LTVPRPRRTIALLPAGPLHPLHQQTPAEFQTYADVEIVSTYGNTPAEYSTLRKGSGKMDLPQRGVLELTGKTRLDFLNRMLTNQTRLSAGQGVYALLLSIKGRIVADMNVLELGERTWLEMDARLVEPTRAELAKFLITEDVTLTSRVGSLYEIALHGPRTADALNLPALKPLESARLTIASVEALVWRDDPCGVPGIHVILPAEQAAQVWTALPHRPIGWAAFNAVRIEAGRPMMGIDFDQSVLPAEIGAAQLSRSVSFTKGCYLGQEIVARMHARGQLARQLVGIRMEGEELPIAGSAIYDADGNTVGGITSSTISPILSNAAICLGIVKKPFFAAQTQLIIPAEGQMRLGTVVELPFVNLERLASPPSARG
jgi:folate-binding protein YgfZ